MPIQDKDSPMEIAVSAFACTESQGSEHELGWQSLKARSLCADKVYLFTSGLMNPRIKEQLVKHDMGNVVVHLVDFPKSIDSFLKSSELFGNHLLGYAWEFLLFTHMLRRFNRNQFDLGVKSSYAGFRWPSFLWYFSKKFLLDPVSGGGGSPLRFLSLLSFKAKSKLLFRMLMQRAVFFDPFVLLTLSHASELHVNNRSTKAITPKFFRKKCILKRDFLKVDAKDFKMEEARKVAMVNPNVLTIFQTGQLLEWKGVMVILQALALLPPTVKYVYTVMGHGPARQIYYDFIKQENLNVTFIDPTTVPRKDLSFYYFSNDLFTFPSFHGDSGHAPVEAKLHGVRLLTLDFSGLEETLTKGDICIRTEGKKAQEVIQEIALEIEKLYYKLKRQPTKVENVEFKSISPIIEVKSPTKIILSHEEIHQRAGSSSGMH